MGFAVLVSAVEAYYTFWIMLVVGLNEVGHDELGVADGDLPVVVALKDAGRPYTEAAVQAKLMGSELAVHAADVAMQVHGGYGFMEESAIPRFYRDAKILTIGEGTSEILKLVIARQMGLSV